MKNLYTRILFSLALVLFLGSFALAQRTITGNISDADSGDPLIGASIVPSGGEGGTVSDLDGNFALKISDEVKALDISYTGYTPQTVAVTGKDEIKITLSSGVFIDEVVVIGYGSAKPSDVTGSISKVTEEDFNKGAFTSPEQLLSGRATGIQITGASGAPGAAIAINIRGFSSLRGNNSPLIVIDGVQLDNRSVDPGGDVSNLGVSAGSNPFAFIDPSEIASMEILKDASATAIYGSRGANGVIIITTKKGRSGDPTIEYAVQQGFSQIANKPDYLSAADYRSALSTEGLGTDNDFGANVDALDAILQTGYTNSHSLGVSGGSNKYTYRIFGSLFDQKGIVQNSRLKKYLGGLKSSFKMLKDDRVTLDFSLTASNLVQDDVPISNDAGYEGSLIGAALQWNPTKSLTKDDGSFDQDIVEQRNPLALNEYIKDQSNITRFIGNVGATVNIIDGLSYRYNISFDQARGERRVGVDTLLNFADIFGRGQAIVGNNILGSVQYLNTLNYDAKITNNIGINAVAGYEHLKYTNRGTTIFATDLAGNTGLDLTDIIESAANQNQRAESFREPDINIRSVFARLIFDINDKYLVTGTIRSDASSKFGKNNRTGLFPSFALGWKISNESFAPDFFDNLKLRAGWGRTGNQEFPAGAAQEYYTYQNGGLSLRNNVNEDLSWESSDQLNVGLDFAFNGYKVSGTLDYFNKKTNDLILFVVDAQPVPSVEGRTYKNVDGVIKNSGLELGLNYNIIEKENLRWNIGVNYTFLTNKVEDFITSINTGAINGQGLTGAFAQKIQNGQSLYSYYLPVYTGLNAEGFSEYEDPVNGGTTIIATVNSVKQFVGDPLPDHLLGITTGVEFAGIDVQLNLNGAFGHQIYNNTNNAVFVKGNLANGRNTLAEQVGNKESSNNSYPASTRYLEEGSYLRIANLTLGYTLKQLPGFLKDARLTLTGQNLYTFTGYSGFDPVVNVDKAIDGIPSFGIDYTPYPTSRTFLVGLSVKL